MLFLNINDSSIPSLIYYFLKAPIQVCMVCIRQINLLILITQCVPTKKRARHRCRLADPASLLHLWSSQCEEPQTVCSTQWHPPEHGCKSSNTVSTESHKNTANSFPNQRKQKHYPRKKKLKNETQLYTPDTFLKTIHDWMYFM